MVAPHSLVSKAISLWRQGERPDARGFIEQHPELKSAQNLVVDLAYEEFCLRQESGEQVDTEQFLAGFPTIQHSLARMLDVHGVMDAQGVKIDVELQWPEAASRLAHAAYATQEGIGRGQVILFASSPTFRAGARASTRVFSNAVIYGPGLGAAPPIIP